MVCIVIARNGTGDVWSFRDRTEARLSPIAQAHDVFASDAHELLRQYGRDEADSLLRFAQGRDRSRLVDAVETWRDGRPGSELPPELRELVWKCVCRAAAVPPKDDSQVVRIIVEDRRALEGRSHRSRSEQETSGAPAPVVSRRGRSMTENTTEAAGRSRVKDDAVIKILADKNPKREGTTSHDRFALYRDGMTVKEAKDAGVKAADISYDSAKGFISVTDAA